MSIIQNAIDTVLDEFKATIEVYVSRLMRRVLKLIVLAAVGVTFVSVGFVFTLISAARFLSGLMQVWLAWGIVGGGVLVVGAILVLFSVKRR